MLKKIFLVTVCAGVLLLSSHGLAVEQYGILSGAVVDESGVGLPGVEVTVDGPALMGARATITNNSGDFRISRLNVGANYSATFSLNGFKSVVKKDIRIELAKETSINVMMKFGEITETVVVTGEVPIVDPKSSTNQVNISREIVENLANDRQYQTIMEMIPGAIPGNNPAMMGASSSDNIYQFDGMESTDPLTKTWSTAMNFDNFEEMQVVAQGAPAEYGRGTGAVINVVTKSGSNQLHGTARISMSKIDWNAGPEAPNTNHSDPTHYLNETRPAINLGGPVIKNHIWFFGSWERRNKWKPAQWYKNPTEALTRTPTGSGKGYYQGHYASAKLTMRLGNFSLMGMWSEDPITMPDMYKYTNSPGYAEANEVTKTQGGWNFNAEATTTLGANTYLVGRFSMKRSPLTLQSHVQEGTRYYQNGFYWGAGPYDYKSERNHNQYLVNLNHFMDTSFGYHDIKLGFEYYQADILGAINYSYPGGEFIVYNELGQTQVRYVYETDVPKQVKKSSDITTFFIQDKWEVSKGLTLNLGFRFEGGVWKNHDGETVIQWNMMDMFAPRLGVAYSFGNNKFHANWGRYYDLYGWLLVNNYQPDDFARTRDIYLGEHYNFSDWYYLNTVYATPPGGATTMDEDLKPSYMDEMGVGYERIIGKNLSLGVSYMHRAWKQKIEDYDPDGDGVWHFGNEDNYHDNNENWGGAFKKYDAVIVTLKKNLGQDRFQFMASYTWSKLRGFESSDAEGLWGDQPYQEVNALGCLDNDIRHQIKFYGSFLLPWDIKVGANLYWFSGKPYTEYVDMYYEDGGATSHSEQYFSYLIDPRGESGRYPSEWRLDLRIEKSFNVKKLFSLSVYADLFNVLNQQNELARDNWLGEAILTGPAGSNDYEITWNNPRYGQFTQWYSPMSLFIGAKVEW
jgi:hypothetical protein